MSSRSHIDHVSKLAEILGFTQIIVFGHSQETGTVVTTWGNTVLDSAQAAAGANAIKKQWDWPGPDSAVSAKVLALQERIQDLEHLINVERKL